MSVYRKTLLTLSLAGLCVVASVPTTFAQSASSTAVRVSDDTLETRIAADLEKDSILAPRDIDVEVEQGRATLTGTVRTAVEKDRAEKLAKIAGVTSVTNDIEIDAKLDQSKIDKATNKTKGGLDKAADAVGKAAEKARKGVEKGADKSADALGKAADKLSDASVTARVNTKFAEEPLLKESAIDVDTANHVVTLKGTVRSTAAKERAGTIAGGVDGVTRVINDLVVDAP